MADVFLSYSSKDRAAADRVQQALTERGIDVFWDQETPPGMDWDTWIRSKLQGCKAAVVLWSKASIASPNVRHEAIVARDHSKLIPAMIDNLAPEDFPMGLYLLQGVQLQDWRNPESKGMARLVAEIESRIGPVTGTPRALAGPKQRKINWVGVAIGLALATASVGLTQWIYSPKTPKQPKDPMSLSEPCPNGLPRIAGGGCPALGEPIRAGGAASFASRLTGRWTTNDLPCSLGKEILIADDRLVIDGVTHEVIEDTGQELRSRVTEGGADDEYRLSPEYLATASQRNFNLLIENLTDSSRQTWTPCE